MRTLDSRLRELVESIEYQKDFKELKKSILLLREQKKYIKGTPVIIFIKLDLIKSQNAGAPYREKIPLKEVQTLLKKGNVNGQYIMIPAFFSEFKAKHGLEYLFDPGQPYHKFNPFHDTPLLVHLPGDGGNKVGMTVDIGYPSRILERKFKAAIRSMKEMWKLKEERKERYSDDEIYEVRKLLREGLNGVEIFRRRHPEYKSFNPMKDYICTGGIETVDKKRVWHTTTHVYDAWAAYRRTQRLVERAKARKP